MYVIDATGALAMAAASQERWPGVSRSARSTVYHDQGQHRREGHPCAFWHRGRRHDTERLRHCPDGPRAGSRLRFVG
jgi:hypothetical protein